MYQLTKKKRHPLVNVVLVVFAISISTELTKLIIGNPSVDEELQTTASTINKQCPMIVDSLTRLDNTAALPYHTIQYNYTFFRSDKKTIDTVALKESMKTSLVNKLKTDPKFGVFRKNNVTVASRFYDSSGIYVCSMQVTPTEY